MIQTGLNAETPNTSPPGSCNLIGLNDWSLKRDKDSAPDWAGQHHELIILSMKK